MESELYVKLAFHHCEGLFPRGQSACAAAQPLAQAHWKL